MGANVRLSGPSEEMLCRLGCRLTSVEFAAAEKAEDRPPMLGEPTECRLICLTDELSAPITLGLRATISSSDADGRSADWVETLRLLPIVAVPPDRSENSADCSMDPFPWIQDRRRVVRLSADTFLWNLVSSAVHSFILDGGAEDAAANAVRLLF